MSKQETIEQHFTLDAAGQDAMVKMVAGILDAGSYKHGEAVKLRLALDTLLLQWMYAGLEGCPCTVAVKRRMLRKTIDVTVRQAAPQAIEKLEDSGQGDGYFSYMMNSLGVVWATSYTDTTAHAQLPLTGRKMNSLLVTLLAMVCALAFSMLLRFLPAEAGTFVMDGLIDPAYNVVIGALLGMVGPFLFVSLMSSTMGMGSLQRLQSTGGMFIKRLLLCGVLGTCLAAVVAVAMFGIDLQAAASSGGGASSVIDIVLAIIPTNMVDPFLQGNTLQIVFLGLFFGIGMLALSQRLPILSKVVLELDQIIRWALTLVLKLVPLLIFLSVTKLVVKLDVSTFVLLAYAFGGLLVSLLVFCLAVFIVARVKTGVGFSTLLSACTPGALIALATASSAAAYWTTATNTEKALKVDRQTVEFTLPLSIPLNHFSFSQWLMFVAAFAMAYQGGTFTPETLFVAIILCVVLGTATPPVPGGALAVYTALFTQMGFGLEALPIIISIDFIVDAVITGAQMLVTPLQILITAQTLENKGEGQGARAA